MRGRHYFRNYNKGRACHPSTQEKEDGPSWLRLQKQLLRPFYGRMAAPTRLQAPRGKQTPCEKKTQHVSRAHCISSCWSSCDVEMSPSSAYFFPSSHSFRSPSVKDVTDGSASLGKHPEVLYSVSLLIVQVEGQQHRLLATLSKCPALNCHLF